MAIEKNIIIKVQDTEVKDATISAKELGTSLDTTNSKSNLTVDVDATQVSSTTVSLDEMGTSLDKASSSANKMSGSLRDVGSNGGAIAVLDRLTGGLATQTRDAFEATKLFNISLKGTRTALIATGIGAFVVALGLVVAYWDDIVDFVTQANKKLEEQNMLIEKQIELIDLDLKLNKLLEDSLIAQGLSTDDIIKKRDELLKAKQLELLAEQQILLNQRQILAGRAVELSWLQRLIKAEKERIGMVYTPPEISQDDQDALDAFDLRIKEINIALVALGSARSLLGGDKDKDKDKPEEREDEVSFLDELIEAKQEEYDIFLFAEEQYQKSLLAIKKKGADDEVELRRGTTQDILDAEIAVAEAKQDIRMADINNIRGVVGMISMLGQESKALQASTLIATNALAIAEVIVATQASNQIARATGIAQAGKTFGTSVGVAEALVAKNNISAGISIAGIGVATAVGLSKLGSSESPSTQSGGRGGGGGSAPSFNLVQGSATNQIAQSVQTGTQPTRAFVVSSDVTSQQSLDRRIEQGSTL